MSKLTITQKRKIRQAADQITEDVFMRKNATCFTRDEVYEIIKKVTAEVAGIQR